MRGVSVACMAGRCPLALEPTYAAIEHWLVTDLAQRVGAAPAAIDSGEQFNRYGLDSTSAAGLIASLAAELGRPLPPTLVWDHPTIAELAGHLAALTPDSPTHGIVRLADDEPIAIVGVACRLPGAADPAAFWRLLVNGTDAVREVPPERWDATAYYDPDPSKPRPDEHTLGRLYRAGRSVRCRVFRHLAARSRRNGSATAVAARACLGSA